MARFQTIEHRNAILLLCKEHEGKDTDTRPLIKGTTNPDIICKDYDIEVETLDKQSLKKRLHKYDKTRRRKMFIVIPNYLKEYFESFEIMGTPNN